jgi:uncharacterized protein (TIGR02147 family)
MKSIFEYLNYRTYLKDVYLSRKKEKKSFSYQVFARICGFKSKSFLSLVMDGKANLASESARAVAKALNLKGTGYSYFLALVDFNQAPDAESRAEKLSTLSRFRCAGEARKIRDTEFEFYARWYHNAIRELAPLLDDPNDYGALSRMLSPRITKAEAKASVALLLRLGLLQKQGRRYVQSDAAITTGDEVRSAAVTLFHKENFNLASRAIGSFPSEQRDISCVIGGMSQECFALVKREIQSFRKHLMALVRDDAKPADRIYHINMQLFPASSSIDRKTNHGK